MQRPRLNKGEMASKHSFDYIKDFAINTRNETEVQKNHKYLGDHESTTQNYAVFSSQHKAEQILPWVEDGHEKLEEYDATGGHVWREAGPSEKPYSPMPGQTEEGPIDQVFPGEEDIFHHSGSSKAIHWSVPWSDLMMTMFILFAVMFIYQSSKHEILSNEGISANFSPGPNNAAALSNKEILFDNYPAIPKPYDLDKKEINENPNRDSKNDTMPGNKEMHFDDYQTIPKLYDMSKEVLRTRHLKSFASVDLIADKAVRIILTGDLLFDIGKIELKPIAKKKLKEITKIIKQTPYMVNVIGHTDNIPVHSTIFPTNWELSVIRACVVARFFIEEMGIPAKKFYLSGHSYFQPVKSNDTAKNRAANRRVEIIITRERPYGTPISPENPPGSSYNRGLGLSSDNSGSLS